MPLNSKGGGFSLPATESGEGKKEKKMENNSETPEGVEFARSVRAQLIDSGLTNAAVNVLFRAAGPGAAIRAFEWAREIRTEKIPPDVVALVLAPAPFGVDRHMMALENLGFPPPPVASRRVGLGRSARDFYRLCAGVVALQRYDIPD